MAEHTKIEWADHTFNPWLGCTRVSPACDHCYAEQWSRRTGNAHLWQGERRRTTEANWNLPLKWNRQAERDGRRFRVFCASMADVFDNQVPDDWRIDLWTMIATAQHLDWLLLTKRPQNIRKMLPDHRVGASRAWPWPNVWLGTTVENQTEADRRIPHLLAVPAAVRFLSCEPLLGPLTIIDELARPCSSCEEARAVCLSIRAEHQGARCCVDCCHDRGIDWIIAGGESGPNARPSHPDWFRGLRDQCAATAVPFLFKQWGEWLPWTAFQDAGFDDDIESTRFRTAQWFDDDGWIDVGQPMWANITDGVIDDEQCVGRVGKQRAGRLLDGRVHDAFPARPAA